MFKCSLKNDHSKQGNKHETDKAFMSGILKIQNGNERIMTQAEKLSCMWLLKENHPKWSKKPSADEDDTTPTVDDANANVEMGDIFAEELEQVEETLREKDSLYINCNFLGISAAIVECLWSKYDAAVPQRRGGLAPIMVEALLFLKENRDCWGIEEVRKALARVKANEKSERTKKKMEAHQAEEEVIAAEELVLGVQDLTVDYGSE